MRKPDQSGNRLSASPYTLANSAYYQTQHHYNINTNGSSATLRSVTLALLCLPAARTVTGSADTELEQVRAALQPMPI